jgi:spore germination protein GerM
MRQLTPRWLLGGLVAALALLGGCGIPEDSKPREISREALPPELIDPAAVATGAALPSDADARFVTLYLVQGDDTSGDALVAVRREVAVPAATADLPRVVAEALIAASPEQMGRADLVNALPSDVQVRSAVVGDDGVLNLDLTNLGNVESSLQRLAVAQLVFTLTDLTVPQVSAVRFSIDGEEVAVPLEGGVAAAGTPVGRAEEPPLLSGPTTTR